jgi:hypothetical protein
MVDTSQIVATADGTLTFPVLNQNFIVIKAILDQLVALGGDTIAVVYIGDEPPAQPNDGALWLHGTALSVWSATAADWIDVANGEEGGGGGASVFVQADEPPGAPVGTLWFDTDEPGGTGGGNGDGNSGGGSSTDFFTDPVAVPWDGNDEFEGNALDAKWVNFNPDWTPTTTVANGRLMMYRPYTDGRTSGYCVPLPTDETWRIVTKFAYFGRGVDACNAGFTFRRGNTAADLQFLWGFGGRGNQGGMFYRFENWANANYRNGVEEYSPYCSADRVLMAIEKTATHWLFQITIDGLNWFTVKDPVPIVDWPNFTHLGLYVQAWLGPSNALFEYIRRVA